MSSHEISCSVESVDNRVHQYEYADRRTIPQVVGVNLRTIRHQYGLTLNDVSKALRSFGFNWSTGRLGDIEAGRGSATVQMVLGLSMALSEACEEPISPLQLLRSEAPVSLDGKWLAVKGEVFERLLSGQQHSVRPGTDTPGPNEGEVLERFDALLSRDEKAPETADAGASAVLSADWDLADSRAAKRLNMRDEDFQRLCVDTWGHLLSVEVRQRADHGASPQKKGRITRQLLEELKAGVERGND